MQWILCQCPWTDKTKTERNQNKFHQTLIMTHSTYVGLWENWNWCNIYSLPTASAVCGRKLGSAGEMRKGKHKEPPDAAFLIRLMTKMWNLISALYFRLIRSWPHLYLKMVHCRHLPMRIEVSASCTSILDCDTLTGLLIISGLKQIWLNKMFSAEHSVSPSYLMHPISVPDLTPSSFLLPESIHHHYFP